MFYLLRWFCGLAMLLEGLCVIMSIGFWWPGLLRKAEGSFLDFCEKNPDKANRKV